MSTTYKAKLALGVEVTSEQIDIIKSDDILYDEFLDDAICVSSFWGEYSTWVAGIKLHETEDAKGVELPVVQDYARAINRIKDFNSKFGTQLSLVPKLFFGVYVG